MATNQDHDSPEESREEKKNIYIHQGNYIENLGRDYVDKSSKNIDSILQRPFKASSPYKGLKKFNADDKDLFFGREKLIQKLIQAVDQSNLVLVLGASGSGKSSVVRAGVIPKLKSFPPIRYQSCLFTPDRNPFESFHSSLGHKDDISHSEIEFFKQRTKKTICQASNLLKSKHSQWLIFIDQFEELFTICSNIETRQNFIQGIVDLAQDKDRSVKLILAMRSDFLEELGAYPEFSDIAEKNINLVADMQTEELLQAIEQPAAKHGVVFEPDLVEDIIRDVQGQAASLPLLQYTLNLLWQESKLDNTERTLKSETYHQLGGVSGALQKHVNQIYQNLSPEQKLATKQILLRLVDVVALEQSEVMRTAVSRRAYKSEFTDTQAETVQFLVDQNLLVSDELKQEKQATVEIAHEALLSSWVELKDWISDARSTIALNNRLAEDAARWQGLRGENQELANEELWTGSKLEKAIELTNYGTFDVVLGGLSNTINDFIDESIKKHDREIKEKLATAKRLAEADRKARIEAERREIEQKKANKQLRIWSLVAVSFGVAASILGIRSYFNGQEALLKQRAADLKVKLSVDNGIERLLESIELVGDNQNFNKRLFKQPTKLMPEVQSGLYQTVQDSREKYDLPIYPVVIFSYERPLKAAESSYQLQFPDFKVLEFNYRVLQLNRLNWRDFLNQRNPVASALMAKMQIATEDRPRVKAECLRLLVTLKLDPAKMQLISGFIDIYLNLDETEEQIFQEELSTIESKEREQVMQIVTSWMRTGIEQGIKRETELILRLLKRKIGQLTPEIEAQVKALEIDTLENLGEALLDFEQLEDLTTWLSHLPDSTNKN